MTTTHQPMTGLSHLLATTSIPDVTPDEAEIIARTELARTLAVLQQLDGDDWTQPTHCPLWNVKQMTAHLAGALDAWSHLGEFFWQVGPIGPRKYRQRGMNQLDAMNQLQVDSRANLSTGELLTRIRRDGPKAVTMRRKLPGLLRRITVPNDPKPITMRYLVDVIYPRDMWMHRYDLCCAAGKQMVLTPEHDGRIVALVMRDLGQEPGITGHSVAWRLAGPAGGHYQIGEGTPEVTITLDAMAFALRTSGRRSAEDTPAMFAGDDDLGKRALAAASVLY